MTIQEYKTYYDQNLHEKVDEYMKKSMEMPNISYAGLVGTILTLSIRIALLNTLGILN